MSNVQLSRCRLDVKSSREQRIQDVYTIPTTEESRVMWFMQYGRKVLLCRESVGGRTCPVEDVLDMCRQEEGVNEAVLVAIGLGLCGNWCRSDFVGHVWKHHRGIVVDVMMYMLESVEEDVGCMLCMDILRCIARDGVGGEENRTKHVAYCLGRTVGWLCRQENVDDCVLECVGVLDTCLLSLPAEYVDKAECGRLYGWIESCVEAGCGDVAPLYQLRARLLLLGCKAVCVIEKQSPNSLVEETISDLEWLIETILYWKPDKRFGRNDVGVWNNKWLQVVAHVAWLVCNTYVCSEKPNRIYSANPVSYAKILQNALETCQSRLDHMICWVLASRVHRVEEQQCILEWDCIPRLEQYDGNVTHMYPWVERQMLAVENKVSIDDTSIDGAIVGNYETDALQTLRDMLFPCVLFCPYRTLHDVFAISTVHENEAWLLVSLLDVFPHLTSLPPLRSGDGLSTEITRLLLDGIVQSTILGNSSFVHIFRMIVQNREHPIVPLHYLRQGLVSLLSGPEEESLDLAIECLLLCCTEPVDTQEIFSIISACLHHLEFSTRYARCVPLKKQTLQNMQDIIERSIQVLLQDPYKKQQVLSDVEASGAHPWARLYFGFEFSDYDAYYILHVNPKLSESLSQGVYRVGNVQMHHTLELAALGSIHTKELCSLAAGYSTMEEYRRDLMGSLHCLFSVCTSSEIMHLMTSLEILCSDVLVQWMRVDNQTAISLSLSSPNLVSICSKAMVIHLCMKSALSSYPRHYHMIPDVCQYSLSAVQSSGQFGSLDWMFIVRVFTEYVTCYACIIEDEDVSDQSIGDACTAVESVVSILCSKAQSNPGIHCRLMAETITQHFSGSSHFMDAISLSLRV